MSDGYAIAAVSAALRQTMASSLARDRVSDIVGNVAVTTLPPDRVIPQNGADPTQLNLFLHQVTPNMGWRNVDLPSRGSSGQRIVAPPLALNLHYLLTAYGDRPHVAEILLGHAMRVLHENATLSRESVRNVLTPTAVDPLLTALEQSGLDDQVELIKITPEAVNTEDMSRLWSALQAQYRPTTAYLVTVVLIEGRASAAPPLPVAARDLQSTALSRPMIETVSAKTGPHDPLLPTAVLEIRGDGLSGPGVEIAIGAATATPAITDISSGRIEFGLTTVGVALRAGVQGVQVRHKVDLGEPPVAHDGEVSNIVPIVLRPTVTNPVVAVSATTGSRKTGTITVNLTPRIGRLQRVGLVLNRSGAVPTSEPRSYAFPGLAKDAMANPADPDTGSLALPFTLVEAADYLLRVEIDGAQSLLSAGTDGRFNAPLVTVP